MTCCPKILAVLAILSIAQLIGETPAAGPLGKLVVTAGHRMHLYCSGVGSPAVVLISGSGDFSFDWALVQPKVSKFTTVSSYDRSGSAWSELGPKPRTYRQEAYNLSNALKQAHVSGPYVLVGQSVVGFIARVFHRLYPADVAGMVLVGCDL